MATAVMGMHRSGTSLTARLLNLAGMYLGEEDEMVPASANNAKGFWEHRPLLELNDEILAHFGGRWDCPPILGCCALAAPRLEPLREKANAIVTASFDGQPHWGWKDPRTTLTLPFWQEILGEPLGCVVCVRNPLAVAASLQKADAMPVAHALALWQFYTERALLNTRPETRVIVFYEDFFTDCAAALTPALKLAGLPPLVPGSARAGDVVGFVDARLRHHRFTPDDVQNSPDVPDEIRRLYALLRERSPAADAFALSRRRPELDRLFRLQCCAYALYLENNRLQTILDSPVHKIVHRLAAPARRFAGVHRVATRALRAVAR